MGLKELKYFVNEKDWNNAAIFILKIDFAGTFEPHNKEEYLTIKSRIIQHVSSSENLLNELIKSLDSSSNKIELFKSLTKLLIDAFKFTSAFKVINHSISTIKLSPYFYQQKINLHIKLDERQAAYDTTQVYCAKFPQKNFGYLKLIQILLLLKRKKEAVQAFELYKSKLENKQILQILQRLNRYYSMDKLCDKVIEETPNSAFWQAKKIFISLKLLKSNDEILHYLEGFLKIRNLKPQDYAHLIPSANLNLEIKNKLLELYERSDLQLKSVKKISEFYENLKNYKKYINRKTNTLKKPSSQKVDLVYSWVDMSEKQFLEKFKETVGFYPDKSNDFQQNQVRYTSIGEIFFSLKTVEAFFKEVNHVYIVTNDQVFDLDFLDKEFQKKITFVFQKNILPKKFVSQTVFDSTLIETFLWNIDGLTEIFIYCCDDYLFGAPLKLNQHVFSREGIPYAIVTPENNNDMQFHKALSEYAKEITKIEILKQNANKNYLNHFDQHPPFKEFHLPMILSKKACEEAFQIFHTDWVNTFFKNTLRSNHSILTLRIFLWYALQEGYQIPGPFHLYNQKSMVFTNGLDEENTKLLQKTRPIFICLNYLLDEESKSNFKYLSENYLNTEIKNENIQELQVLFDESQYKDYLEKVDIHFDLEGRPIEVLKKVALSHFYLNNFEQAISAIKKAKKLEPDQMSIDKIMAKIYMKNRNWTAAEKILLEEIKIENFNFEYFKRYIQCLTQLNKTEELFQLSSIVSNQKESQELNFMIGSKLLLKKKYEQVDIIREQYLLANSVKSISLNILSHFRQENHELALGSIQSLFEKSDFVFDEDENIPVHFAYCQILTKQEKWDLAIKQCNLCINTFQKSLQFRNLLLSIYHSTNNIESYSELLEDTYSKFGNNKPWILNKYITHLQLTGQDEKAIEILKTNIEGNQQAFKMLLKIYLGKGDFDSFIQLSQSEEFDTADKLVSLEGTISSYLSLGYFKSIPSLIKSVVNTQTDNMELSASKSSVLNLGNRFYNLINSSIIHTNLALLKEDKAKIIKELNEINYEFNTRKLTFDLLSTAKSDLGESVDYIVKLIPQYLEKLESHENVWLDTYENPNQAFEIVEILKKRIKDKTPTSLIRLGDGEGNFMDYPKQFKKQQSDDQEAIQTIWWQDSVITDQKTKTKLSFDLEKSISSADIIGVYPDRRLFRVLGRALSQNKVERGHRGGIAIMNSVVDNNLKNKILTSSHCHFDLETWDLYQYLLSEVDKLSVITCHESIKEYLTERFGIKEIDLLKIPSEKKYAKLFGYHEKQDHYPTRFHEILKQVSDCEKGQVFLVAAGFLGKMYCTEIKEAGGIAIDIGSITDYWLNFKTRNNDNAPPVKNGFRFGYEIENKLELPLESQLTKTNHYCNKQVFFQNQTLKSHKFKFLITGHPRSGTRFISNLCKEFGFKIGHERLEDNGICSWLHAASNLNTPLFGYDKIAKYNISRYEMHPENVLLLVRHPKDIIPSIILENGISLSYNYRRYHIHESSGIDLDHYNDTLEKAIVSYIEWIRLIEKQKIDGIIRLENAQEDLEQFFQKNKLKYKNDIDQSNIINRNTTKDKFGIEKPIITTSHYKAINKNVLSQLIQFCTDYQYDLSFLELD